MTAALSSFARFLILFHSIIPVSLLATVQVVRLIQVGIVYIEATISYFCRKTISYGVKVFIYAEGKMFLRILLT